MTTNWTGEEIRRARRERGISQTELAAGLVSVAYLSLIETGQRDPSERVMREIIYRIENWTPRLSPDLREMCQNIESHITADRPEEAQQLIRKLERTAGANSLIEKAVRLFDAMALERRGNHHDSREQFRHSVHEIPINDPLWLRAVIEFVRTSAHSGQIQESWKIAEFALFSIRESEELNYSDHAYELRATLACMHANRGEIERAISLLDYSKEKFPTISDWAEATRLWAVGFVEIERENYEDAYIALQRGIELMRTLDKPRSVLRLESLGAHAGAFYENSDAEKILGYLDAAELKARMRNASADLAGCLNNRAYLFAHRGESSKALQLAQTALAMVEGMPANYSDNYHTDLAEIQLQNGLVDECRESLRKSLEKIDRTESSRWHQRNWWHLAELHHAIGEHDIAFECARHAMSLINISSKSLAAKLDA
jgi:tetratricopeptide (TPR) repeat protein